MSVKMCESLGHEQVRRKEKSFGGELLAVICGACQNPISIVCPACKSETKDLRKHFKDKVACWKKADLPSHKEWQRQQAKR